MSFNLLWDQNGDKLYETGTDRVVLYPFDSQKKSYPLGVAWNGVTALTESPSGAEATALYANNTQYLELRSAEKFGATIEAYTYPDEWTACDGSAKLGEGVYLGQQKRIPFGLCYRTVLGNDEELNEFGYKLHIVYGATASPSQRSYATINDSTEAITFSWEISTTPVEVPGFKPTAHIEIDSSKIDATKLAKIETILYGTAAVTGGTPAVAVPARLLFPSELATILKTV